MPLASFLMSVLFDEVRRCFRPQSDNKKASTPSFAQRYLQRNKSCNKINEIRFSKSTTMQRRHCDRSSGHVCAFLFFTTRRGFRWRSRRLCYLARCTGVAALRLCKRPTKSAPDGGKHRQAARGIFDCFPGPRLLLKKILCYLCTAGMLS